MNPTTDRDAAVEWARHLVTHYDDWLALDTETTGIHSPQPVSVAVLNPDGRVLFNSLVKPIAEISARAAAIHHITADQVADAPGFPQVYRQLVPILAGKTIVTYNANFDRETIDGTATLYSLRPLLVHDWQCAMKHYAAYIGEYSRFGHYRYQPLPGRDHSAAGDVRAMLLLIHRMAAARLSTEIRVPVMEASR